MNLKFIQPLKIIEIKFQFVSAFKKKSSLLKIILFPIPLKKFKEFVLRM